jgi:hypothetical protein
MRYWVYGVDQVSREQREPLFIEAATEADARAWAKGLGMAVEEVEAVEPKVAPSSAPAGAPPAASQAEWAGPGADHPVAEILVVVFRGLAAVVVLLYVVLFMMTLQAANKAEEVAKKLGSRVEVPGGAAWVRVILEAVVVVSLLLAVAELLRLGIALERNTRGRPGPGEKRRNAPHPPDHPERQQPLAEDPELKRRWDQLEREALEAIHKERAAERLLTPRARIKKGLKLPGELPLDYKADESVPVLAPDRPGDDAGPTVLVVNQVGIGLRIPQVLFQYLYQLKTPTAAEWKVINDFLLQWGLDPVPI